MTPISGIVTALGVVVLLAALLLRKQLEKAGAPLIVPLVVLVLAGAAVAAYSNHRAYLKALQHREQLVGGEQGAPGGGRGGGMGHWRERFAHRLALTGLVRRLPVLDKQKGRALSAEQAAKLVQILAPLRTEAKLAKEPTLALVAKAKTVLTPEQIAAFDAIKLPRLARRARWRGRPEGEAATRPAAPAPAATTSAAATTTARPERRDAGSDTRERREGRRRRSSPDGNPFLRERYKPMLDALMSLLEQRASKTPEAAPPAAKPAEG